ncbi:MAG TPA: IS1 family transposase [Pyrinomonadaceae bacterium]|nr:IS1 family transposase [Pyrinomonadaceae bacterium]
MSNYFLSKDKQITVTAALAEGNSIRSIERMTGIHRDTIMRLGVRIGQGCARLMDEKMRGLDCKRLELDEIWVFIGKKQAHVKDTDDPTLGTVWTFCAIDAETKIVPSYRVSNNRNIETTAAFITDLASRLNNRVQISTDAMNSYPEAIELAFGREVDYAQIVKSYSSEDSGKYNPERKYSQPRIKSSEKIWIMGTPDPKAVSTSYVERLNASTRLHVKRLNRLTLAFSKKLENFEAAVALNFASHKFVKSHRSLKMTPAMAAGVERKFWSYGDLVEAAL